MRFLFYFGHPAQYLFFRDTINKLKANKLNTVLITIKSKDVLEDLIKNDQIDYINIQPKERGLSIFSILLNLFRRFYKLLIIAYKFKPGLLIGTDATIAYVGLFLRRTRVTITEDDFSVIKNLAKLTYPITNYILCPKVCDVASYEQKKIGYNGYMKLSYLHPSVFKPDYNKLIKYNIENKFIIIRLAKLTAHHDIGIKGINEEFLDEIIQIIESKGYRVFISSEKKIQDKFIKYQLKINPSDMHHLLYLSDLLISDSQSMSMEAAMLGTPSIRISDFAGRISVLNELELKFGLTFGYKPNQVKPIIDKIDELLNDLDLKLTFQDRRKNMLNQKINVNDYLFWLFSDFSKNSNLIKLNSEIETNFI
jgi:predicted glycosyltransferase